MLNPLAKPEVLLALFQQTKAQKFRIRRTSDMNDFLVVGTTKYNKFGHPERFTVLNLQTGDYNDTDAGIWGYVLLSNADEVKTMRSMSEHEVLPVIRAAYGIKSS